jgi:hypothetical protein
MLEISAIKCKNNIYMKLIIQNIIFICVFVVAFISPRVNAQEIAIQPQTSLGVDPAILEMILDPTTTTTKQITITNYSNIPQPIKTLAKSFTPKEKLELTPEELKIFDASSWISIDDLDKDFILQPHQSKTVTINITQPEKASPGGHYATILFQPLIPEELVSEQSIFVYSRVAVLVFLQVKGDIVQNIDYTTTKYSTVSEPGSQSFDFSIKNSGNTHIQPSINFYLYDDTTGEIIDTEAGTSGILLPKAEKMFHYDANLSGKYGKYSVEMTVTYGSESTVLKSGKKSVIVFPFTSVFLIYLPSIIIIAFVFKFRTRFRLAYRALTNGKEEVIKIEPTKKNKIKFKIKR